LKNILIKGNLWIKKSSYNIIKDSIKFGSTITVDVDNPAELPQVRIRWQLDNHLGSSSTEFDNSAQVISYEEYHPFGSTSFHTVKGGADVNAERYRYTGKERDDETRLYYYGTMYYAAWLGRWTGCDPMVSTK
jgi:RHS repeat-associated protein